MSSLTIEHRGKKESDVGHRRCCRIGLLVCKRLGCGKLVEHPKTSIYKLFARRASRPILGTEPSRIEAFRSPKQCDWKLLFQTLRILTADMLASKAAKTALLAMPWALLCEESSSCECLVAVLYSRYDAGGMLGLMAQGLFPRRSRGIATT
jgi:hypothetical protein